MDEPPLRTVVWIGPTRKELKTFPRPVQRAVGLALYAAQLGEMPPDAKPLKGFSGAGVVELVEDHRGDTYRAVYTVRFATRIYVLHVFQKKSKHGIATPKKEIELIRARLRWTERLYIGTTGGGLKMETTHEESSGNVFADLGLPNSEQELVKAKLTVQIYQILRDRKITQIEAARLLGTTQAQVSALMRCRPVSVSVGKLMEFLTTLGQDVEVTVKPTERHGAGHMSVTVQPS